MVYIIKFIIKFKILNFLIKKKMEIFKKLNYNNLFL